jgi:hypothetical protein
MGKPRPVPLSSALVKERFENALEGFFLYARTRIPDAHFHASVLRRSQVDMQLLLPHIFHGLHRVHDQVAKDLLYLGEVSPDRGDGGELPLDHALFGNSQLVQVVQYLVQFRAQVQHLIAALFRFAQVEHLFDQRLHPPGRFHDIIQQFGHFLAFVRVQVFRGDLRET